MGLEIEYPYLRLLRQIVIARPRLPGLVLRSLVQLSRPLLSRILWELSVSLIFLSLTWCFFSEILKQDRFHSYSGTHQLMLFGVTERCLFGHVHRFYASVQQSVGSKIAFSDWPIEVGQYFSLMLRSWCRLCFFTCLFYFVAMRIFHSLIEKR